MDKKLQDQEKEKSKKLKKKNLEKLEIALRKNLNRRKAVQAGN